MQRGRPPPPQQLQHAHASSSRGDGRDVRDGRNARDFRDVRDARDLRDVRDVRDVRDGRDQQPRAPGRGPMLPLNGRQSYPPEREGHGGGGRPSLSPRRGEEDAQDDFFSSIYERGYSGPLDGRRSDADDRDGSRMKRRTDDDIPDFPHYDDNGLPLDFTSREARGWEAKAKSTERHYKRRKEEEMTCKICGEYGHFAQGCPNNLPPRQVTHIIKFHEARLRPKLIGPGGSVVQGLEKESGCRINFEVINNPAEGAFQARIIGPDSKAVALAEELLHKMAALHQDVNTRGRVVTQPRTGMQEHLAQVQRPGPGPAQLPHIPTQHPAAGSWPPPGGHLWNLPSSTMPTSNTMHDTRPGSSQVQEQYQQPILPIRSSIDLPNGFSAASAAQQELPEYQQEEPMRLSTPVTAPPPVIAAAAAANMSSKVWQSLEDMEAAFRTDVDALAATFRKLEEEEKKRHEQRMRELKVEHQAKLLERQERYAQDEVAFRDRQQRNALAEQQQKQQADASQKQQQQQQQQQQSPYSLFASQPQQHLGLGGTQQQDTIRLGQGLYRNAEYRFNTVSQYQSFSGASHDTTAMPSSRAPSLVEQQQQQQPHQQGGGESTPTRSRPPPGQQQHERYEPVVYQSHAGQRAEVLHVYDNPAAGVASGYNNTTPTGPSQARYEPEGVVSASYGSRPNPNERVGPARQLSSMSSAQQQQQQPKPPHQQQSSSAVSAADMEEYVPQPVSVLPVLQPVHHQLQPTEQLPRYERNFTRGYNRYERER